MSKKNKFLGSKKKKILFKKLGISETLEAVKQSGSNMRNTLNDIIKTPPTIVCGRCIESCIMQIESEKIKLEKNKEIVMPLGLFFQGKKNKQSNTRFLKPSSKPFIDRFRRYRGEDLTDKNLLIWRFGGIGDLMFAQPLVMYLRKKYPTCKITFSTSPANLNLFRNWPVGLVNQTIPMPFFSNFLDDNDYHLTFEGAIERCKEAHTVCSVDIFSKIANLDFDPREYQIKLIPDPNLTLQMNQIIPENTIALQIRSSSPVRTLTIPKAIELINFLTDMKFNVGIIDSSKTAGDIDQLLSHSKFFKNHSQVFNLAKLSTSLTHCISILKSCCGAIATDSSITHLSSALQKPTVGIYGPFLGELRMKYYNTGDWINASDSWNDCNMCPCFFHENELRQCPYVRENKQIGCMNSINILDVAEKFVGLYEKFGKDANDIRLQF